MAGHMGIEKTKSRILTRANNQLVETVAGLVVREFVAGVVVRQFVARFGCPLEIHTVQGKKFESELFKEMCELLEIGKTRTTSYRPCAYGQV